MTTIGAFFQKELNGETFPQALLAGEITGMAISRADRSIQVSARFSQFVEYEDIQRLGRKLQGYDAPDAVLTAVESRSSSPVRILRGPDGQSALRGLYPCGEGAGYAGGILSAAADGMRAAEALLNHLQQGDDLL